MNVTSINYTSVLKDCTIICSNVFFKLGKFKKKEKYLIIIEVSVTKCLFTELEKKKEEAKHSSSRWEGKDDDNDDTLEIFSLLS